MLPDRVSNPGPLTYESGVLPIALRGPARLPGEQVPNFSGSRVNKHLLQAFFTRTPRIIILIHPAAGSVASLALHRYSLGY